MAKATIVLRHYDRSWVRTTGQWVREDEASLYVLYNSMQEAEGALGVLLESDAVIKSALEITGAKDVSELRFFVMDVLLAPARVFYNLELKCLPE